MDVRLVVKKGASGKRTMRLKSEETIIGRRQDCDLRIRSSEVSRRHCLLSFQDGVLHVEDLDSVNGTFLNGVRVAGRQVIRPGDRLEVGPIQFLVEYALSREARASLQQGEAEAVPAEEELDALPIAEAEDVDGGEFNFGSGEELDAIPLSDEDTEFAQPKAPDQQPAEVVAAEDDDSIPVADEILEGREQLPQSNDLRDILSQMDEPKGKRRPKDEE
jgi:pSer/pThr/pTyr-binding forkhead associated (FHA) protein